MASQENKKWWLWVFLGTTHQLPSDKSPLGVAQMSSAQASEETWLIKPNYKAKDTFLVLWAFETESAEYMGTHFFWYMCLRKIANSLDQRSVFNSGYLTDYNNFFKESLIGLGDGRMVSHRKQLPTSKTPFFSIRTCHTGM